MEFKAAPVTDDSAEQLYGLLLAIFSAPEIVIGLAAAVLIVGLAMLRHSTRARRKRRRVQDVIF